MSGSPAYLLNKYRRYHPIGGECCKMTNTDGTQLLQSFSDAVAQLAESVSPSVVGINAGRRSGTGVVWSSDGLVLTASHVIGRSTEPVVTLSDGRELGARVVGRDPYSDVALLKVDAGGLTPIKRGSSREAKAGQFVMALSSAFSAKPSVTAGVITAPSRSMRGWWGIMIENAVVSDAKLNPGYSGGPLVDAWGKMLGMNVAYFSGRGIATPTESLDEVAQKIAKDGRVKKGFLGVVVEPLELPERLSNDPSVGQRTGLLVRAIDDESPAKTAGVSIGDVLFKLGESRVTDEFELHRALAGDVVGKQVSLWVLRGERPVELRATPREAEE